MDSPQPFLIDGAWHLSETTADVVFPYDGSIVGSIALAGVRDLEHAVATARRGAAVMRRLPAHRRSGLLARMADLAEAEADALAATIVLEAGKTIALARVEVERAVATLRISADEARRIGGEIIDLDWTPAGEGCTGYLRRVPVGVVLAITPSNFPLNLVCHKLGPALAAGNAAIVRPSTATPLSALALGRLALEAGCPPEGIAVVPCRTMDAERLVVDPRIDLLSFTGSAAVGWRTASAGGSKTSGPRTGRERGRDRRA